MTDIPADIEDELNTLLDEADVKLRLSTRDGEPDEIQRRIPQHLSSIASTDDALVLGAARGEAARRAVGWE